MGKWKWIDGEIFKKEKERKRESGKDYEMYKRESE